MDKSVPAPAGRILNFIGSIEAPNGYDTLYGNAQKRYSWRLTQLTVGEVLRLGPGWSRKRSEGGHGSSACGRYQFMAGRNHTLAGLVQEFNVPHDRLFDAALQDQLGYALLRRRKYDQFILGTVGVETFALELAKEWASMPVLAACRGPENKKLSRGQSYYAGDGLNHSLCPPERLEAVLVAARATPNGRAAVEKALKDEEGDAKRKASANAAGVGGTVVAGGSAGASLEPSTFDWTAWAFVGGFALLAAVLLFFLGRAVFRNVKRVRAFKQTRKES